MSCFVLEPERVYISIKIINQLTDYIFSINDSINHLDDYILNKYGDSSIKNFENNFCYEIYKLNIEAYNCTYKNNKEVLLDKINYDFNIDYYKPYLKKFKETIENNQLMDNHFIKYDKKLLFQALKTLDCYYYNVSVSCNWKNKFLNGIADLIYTTKFFIVNNDIDYKLSDWS